MKKIIILILFPVSVFSQTNLITDKGVRTIIAPVSLSSGSVINILGDSYSLGGGATNTSYGYDAVVSAQLGTTENNLAVTSRGTKVSAVAAYTSIAAGNANSTIFMSGLNDARRNGSNVTLNPKTAEKIKSCERATIANNFLLSAVAANNAGVTASGAWTTTSGIGDKASLGLSGLVRVSAASGNTLTYTFTGSSLVIGTFSTDEVTTTGGDWTYSIDAGVYTGSYTGKNKTDGISDGITDNSICPNAVIITNMGSGSHTIVITASAVNVRIDYFGLLQPQQAGAPFIISAIPKMAVAGYAVLGGSDAVWNQADAAQQEVIAEFANYPVFFASVNTFYTIPAGVSSDSIHPNNLGHMQLASGILSVINRSSTFFSTGLTRTGNTITNNLSTGVSGGQTLIGSTSTNSGVTYKSTTGVGTTGADHIFKVGNNGATEAMRILNSGLVAIGTATAISSKTFSVQTAAVADGVAINAQTTGYPTTLYYVNGTLKSWIGATRSAGDVNASTGAGDFFIRTEAANMDFIISNLGLIWKFNTSGHLIPGTTATYDIGSSSVKVRNEYIDSSLVNSGSMSTGYVSKATSYTATGRDHTIEVTATGQTITLPTAVGISGREYVIKLTSSASTSTVATTSSQTIDGSTTYSLSAQYKYIMVQSNGADWLIIANN